MEHRSLFPDQSDWLDWRGKVVNPGANNESKMLLYQYRENIQKHYNTATQGYQENSLASGLMAEYH